MSYQLTQVVKNLLNVFGELVQVKTFSKDLRVACSTPYILNTSAFDSVEKTADDRSYSDFPKQRQNSLAGLWPKFNSYTERIFIQI